MFLMIFNGFVSMLKRILKPASQFQEIIVIADIQGGLVASARQVVSMSQYQYYQWNLMAPYD